jgi:hypothetical protein
MDYQLTKTNGNVDLERLQENIPSELQVFGLSSSDSSITVHSSIELSIADLSSIQELIDNSQPLPSVPPSVSPRQMRIALITSGVSLQDIEDTLDSLPEPHRSIAKVTWEYSVEFQRNNPILISLAPMLGLTEQQVDDLFILASTL